VNILVPNLGSTSLKWKILEMPAERIASRGRLERVSNYGEAVRQLLAMQARIDAVAFKAVHAGPRYRCTCLIDDGLLDALQQFLPAAPLHNSIYISCIEAFRKALPETALVAALETEFHSSVPEHAARYGVPAEWRERDGIRRYGFHGASHHYVSIRSAEMLGSRDACARLVSCHLGGSSSVCAIRDGHSLDTTMGFSPQSGLENATRCGDLDVFAVLYMMERHGWTTAQIREQLAGGGGLAGLSGVAGGDIRDIELAAASGSRDASLALETFAYGVRKAIGAYAAAMGGVDAVVFTGGAGEHSARLRAACLDGLGFLGISLDEIRNVSGSGDRTISAEGARPAVLTLSTDEELIVARRAYALLAAASKPAA
jgi:acetate kinase